MWRILFRPLACSAFALSMFAIVHADNPYAWWTQMGATGSPTSATASLAQFNSAGTVQVRSSAASGTLRLKYNVTAVDGVLDRTADHQRLCLMMVARADTSDSRVISTLYRQAFGDNQSPFVIGSIDTADFPANGSTGYRFMENCGLTDDAEGGVPLEILRFGYHAYFIEAQLIKRTSAANPGLQSLAIGRIGT